jgi:translation initiation factor 3 subunit B
MSRRWGHGGGDFSLLDEEKREEEPDVQLDKSLSNVIVINGLPKIDKKTESKFMDVLSREFNMNMKDKVYYMPYENQKSKGYMFLELPQGKTRPDQYAREFIRKFQGHKFKGGFRFSVYMMDELEAQRGADAKSSGSGATPESFCSWKLFDWLLDPLQRDQQLTICGKSGSVKKMGELSWRDTLEGTQEFAALEKKIAHDAPVVFSPEGTFLCMLHDSGAAIYGGALMDRLFVYPHEGVQAVDVSPCERYIVTWSNVGGRCLEDPGMAIVWDLLYETPIMEFDRVEVADTHGNIIHWPILKWSYDDEYLMQVRGETLVICSMKGMSEDVEMGFSAKEKHVFEKAIPGLKWCEWIPRSKKIIYWTEATEHRPARVSVVNIPDMGEVGYKSVTNVKDLIPLMHPHGKYCLFRVVPESGAATAKTTGVFTMLLSQKLIPTVVGEIESTTIEDIQFEPKGNRLAVACGGASALFRHVLIYKITKTGMEKDCSIEKRLGNRISWSPMGRFFVLTTEPSRQHERVEFIDADSRELVNAVDQPFVSDVAWDPSGLMVATSVTIYHHHADNGYCLWNAIGERIDMVRSQAFWQFLWRPRPRFPVNDTKIQSGVMKNLDEWEKKDDQRFQQVYHRTLSKWKEERTSFGKWLTKWGRGYEDLVDDYRKKGIMLDSQEELVEEEVEVEEFLGEETRIVDA